MRISLTLFMVLLCTGKVWAFDADFFRNSSLQDIRIQYRISNCQTNETDIHVTNITEDTIEGTTVGGNDIYIPINEIVTVIKVGQNQRFSERENYQD